MSFPASSYGSTTEENRPIPNDGEPYWDEYNLELAELAIDGRNTWFTAPWLYAE